MAFFRDDDEYDFVPPQRRRVIPLAPPPQDTSGTGVVPPPAGAPEPEYIPPFNYQPPAYRGPQRPQYRIPRVPQFDAPDFDAPEFQAPDPEGIFRDPSFQFRLNRGVDALEASAAARGTLRSGNTLTGITDYAQDAASQEYGNIWNRSLQDYENKFRRAQADYNARFQGASAEYLPNFRQWEELAGAERSASDQAFQRAWDEYRFGLDDEFRRENMILGYGAPR